MNKIPLSNCEKEFLLKGISEKKRIDGRECYDYRPCKITFGIDRGCCNVDIGNTRILAQVSCQVEQPKQSRPTEGLLFVNVELSPMAAPQFEAGRQSDEAVEITRILERCIKESRCIDMESLCISAGLKVWAIRVDIHVLNHEGNLIDCASIASIAALAHFRRPDVTVSGEEITIHTLEDRDPVPLSVHHMPICITFAFYEQGKYLLNDPIEKEERVMDGKMVIGMNKHREICTLQMTGSMLLLKDQVMRCSNIAVVKVKELTELIQQALENDTQARAKGEPFGFAASVEPEKLSSTIQAGEEVLMEEEEVEQENVVEKMGELDVQEAEEEEQRLKANVIKRGPNTATIGEGGANTWKLEDLQAKDMDVTEKRPKKKVTPPKRKAMQLPPPKEIQGSLEGESEEEETTVTMEVDELSAPKPVKPLGPRKFIGGGSIDLSAALKAKKQKKGKKKS